MNKNQIANKKIQRLQDEIFRKMSVDKKMRLVFKLNSEIFKPVRDKIKSQYSNLNPLLLSQKIYSHINSNREYYDNLFDRKLEKELRIRFNFKDNRQENFKKNEV